MSPTNETDNSLSSVVTRLIEPESNRERAAVPKTIPACPAVPVVRSSGQSTEMYRIRLLTPWFGGGVIPGETDPSFPIRGTAIRGQLQFWWRATRGAGCETTDDLIERHAAVWGSTAKASPVEVEVRDWQAAEPRRCARYEGKSQPGGGKGGYEIEWQSLFRIAPDPREDALSYVLFPFQGKPPSEASAPEPEKAPASFIESAAFTLRVRFPGALEADVRTAVWAWVNFGGLGARTRRGCGALLCEQLAPKNFENLPAWFRSGAPGASLHDHPWPTLPSLFLAHPEVGPPLPVWNRLIRSWRSFRQGIGFARNPSREPNRPGRSRYPEPETIRELTHADRRRSGHGRLDSIPIPAFPRSELGLPIVFHFQGRGEPPDTILYPRVGGEHTDRMASPLILKPLALADRRAVALIMRLRTPQLTEIELRRSPAEAAKATPLGAWGLKAIRDPRFVDATYRDSPMRGLTGDGSALEAFLARAVQNGFKEVKL